MRAKIGLITAFLLIVALAPGLTFADDFQSYNAVTDASFTLNYTINPIYTGNEFIAQAPDDSLSLTLIAQDSQLIAINESKLNLSYPFSASITLRKNSYFPNAYNEYINFLFFTNATDSGNLTNSRGYRINYFRETSTITLRRCPNDITNIVCGVILNSSIFNLTIDGFNTTNNLTSDLIFTVSMDSSKHIKFYANNILELSYYDTAETYLSGGFAFGREGTMSPAVNYWDNINSNATIGAPGGALPGWHLYSFPMNQLDLIGFGLYTGEVWQACPKSGTPIYNTPYQFSFGTIELDEPCFDWFYAGFPSNGTVMSPFFLLKHDGDWVSHTLTTTLNLSTVIGFQATHENTCYISNKYTGNGQLDWAIPVNGWVASVPIYIMSHRNGTYAQNNPYVFYGYDIYCVAPENLTFYLQTITYEPSFTSVLTTINVPIGIYIDPITGEVNYSRLSNFTYAPSVLRPCVPGDLRVICAPPGTAGGLITDFGGLEDLITPMLFLLGAVIFFAVAVTKESKSSDLGLITVMAGVLLLSYFNVLPWYITILITIGAGFFLLSKVRTGVFGHASTA